MTGPEAFGSTLRSAPWGRSEPLTATERRLAPLIGRVPITRIYDATPLDRLNVPVWGAVTPLARDLTVHAGRGASALAARISATMEAIERVSAEDVDEKRVRRESFASIRGQHAIDPVQFDLPFETIYAPDRPLSWVEGYDLLEDRSVWVPLDVVISPAREGICLGVETNGLAAGNTLAEATVHALHEVIERDAEAHDQFARLYADRSSSPVMRLLDLSSLPAMAAALVQTLSAADMSVIVQDLTHDLDVPVFRATIYDRDFPGSEGRARRFEGLGADLDAAHAVSSAICEAAQAHTAVVIGARDAFEQGQRHTPHGSTWLVERLLTPTSVEPFQSDGDIPTQLSDRLRILLERLSRAGCRHCVVVELTRPDLGVPVVRVLVPGLAGPYGDTTRRPARRLLRILVQLHS